jgi:shikimate kinase
MGAGKTTVGRLLAERWGVAFRDSDVEVERMSGQPISELFVECGEAAFRELERTAVAIALAGHDGVLALGGGAIMHAATRQDLMQHRVIFLRVGFAQTARRVGLDAIRPAALAGVRGQLKRMLDERTPIYESVAADSVDTDMLTPAQVVDQICELPGLALQA